MQTRALISSKVHGRTEYVLRRCSHPPLPPVNTSTKQETRPHPSLRFRCTISERCAVTSAAQRMPRIYSRSSRKTRHRPRTRRHAASLATPPARTPSSSLSAPPPVASCLSNRQTDRLAIAHGPQVLTLIGARESAKATCMRLATALADSVAHRRSKTQHARLADQLARALNAIRQVGGANHTTAYRRTMRRCEGVGMSVGMRVGLTVVLGGWHTLFTVLGPAVQPSFEHSDAALHVATSGTMQRAIGSICNRERGSPGMLQRCKMRATGHKGQQPS
jgi:hypothetical protein